MLNLWDKWSIEWHDRSQVRFRRMASQNSNRRRICAMFNALDSKVSSSGWVIMLWSWERLYVKRSINTASCWRLETRISSHATVFFVTKQKSSLFWLLYRSFVAVSEVYLKNYFDKALSGALADQVRYLFYGCYQLKTKVLGRILLIRTITINQSAIRGHRN